MTYTSLRLLGLAVYNRTFELSRRINTELLEPISKWLNDPDFMDRFKVNQSDRPSWAEYKRRQREYDLNAAWEAMKLKRRARKRLSEYKKYISGLIPKRKPTKPQRYKTVVAGVAEIVVRFCPQERFKAEINREFNQVARLHVSDLLPWGLLISQQLQCPCTFSRLRVHYSEDPVKDKVSKLVHLLQMETEGKIVLRQDTPFGEIEILPIDVDTDQSVAIKDRSGRSYRFDWRALSDNQRDRIVADAKDHQILCKVIHA